MKRSDACVLIKLIIMCGDNVLLFVRAPPEQWDAMEIEEEIEDRRGELIIGDEGLGLTGLTCAHTSVKLYFHEYGVIFCLPELFRQWH